MVTPSKSTKTRLYSIIDQLAIRTTCEPSTELRLSVVVTTSSSYVQPIKLYPYLSGCGNITNSSYDTFILSTTLPPFESKSTTYSIAVYTAVTVLLHISSEIPDHVPIYPSRFGKTGISGGAFSAV